MTTLRLSYPPVPVEEHYQGLSQLNHTLPWTVVRGSNLMRAPSSTVVSEALSFVLADIVADDEPL